jgi:chromosomal replication initiation ATPase DnaA
MTRLAELRTMLDFINREIAIETSAEIQEARKNPALLRASSLYGVSVDRILLGDRRHQVTRARHAAAWLLHEQGMSMQTVGRILGYGDKGAVHRAISRVQHDVVMLALVRGLEVTA